MRYATLDDVAATSADPAGSQVDPLDMPAGWAVAPSDATSRAAAAQFTWGTDCLVLADGSLVATRSGVDCEHSHLVTQNTLMRATHKRILIAKARTSEVGGRRGAERRARTLTS